MRQNGDKTMIEYIVCFDDGTWELVVAENAHEAIKQSQGDVVQLVFEKLTANFFNI